ncbi:MAG: hypothetical protein WCO44_11015 [Bacteroidota bacterium]
MKKPISFVFASCRLLCGRDYSPAFLMRFIFIVLLMSGIEKEVFSSCVIVNGTSCHGQAGGNQPCFNTNQVISDCWYDPSYRIKEIYIGACTIRDEYYDIHGTLFQTLDYPGGCYCDYPMPYYNPTEYPMTDFWVKDTLPGSLQLSNSIAMSKVEAWQLSAGGATIFSFPGPLAPGLPVLIPNAVFQNDKDYLVIGFDIQGNATSFLPFRKVAGHNLYMKYFCSWGTPESVDLQRKCVAYVNPGSVMVYFQRLGLSGFIVKGTTDAPVSIPTLGQWAMVFFGILLFGTGVRYLRPRNYAQSLC